MNGGPNEPHEAHAQFVWAGGSHVHAFRAATGACGCSAVTGRVWDGPGAPTAIVFRAEAKDQRRPLGH